MSLFAVSISAEPNQEQFERLLASASPAKRAKAASFRCRDDAWRTLIGEALARSAVGASLGCSDDSIVFVMNEYGKPFVKDEPHLHFNVSHSGSWIVCAIGGRSVGVDVERMKPIDLSVAYRYFSSREQRDLAEKLPHEQEDYFYDLWTLKESYLKFHGGGLGGVPLDSFTVRVKQDGTVIAHGAGGLLPYNFRRYSFAPGYKVALCAQEPDLPDVAQILSVNHIVEELLR